MNKKLLIGLLVGMLIVSVIYAASFVSVVSNCVAEDNSVKGIFGGTCDDTTGASLQTDDASLETHTYQKSRYGGVRIQSVNTSITNCQAIQQVFICYKWWRTATATPQDCDVSVDANAGASYSTVTTTCPGTTEPAAITCTNVTALETWTCDNFFGTTGTRAYAKSELSRIGTGAATTETGTWDALYFNVTYTAGVAPTIANITSSHATIKGGNTITIYANTSKNGVNDTNGDTLSLYCSEATSSPTSANTICTGGTTTGTYPYNLTCAYATTADNTNHTVFCRLYDSALYSSTVNTTYTTDSTAPTTTILSVAGDTTASYFDKVNDGQTEINVSGEANMACRWSSSDLAYGSMSNACTIHGTVARCLVNDVVAQGFTTRYVACQDNLTNAQNSTTNLNVQFTLDYTAPTTSDNSVSTIQAPNYTVTITESDNVDGDPTTYYCSSSTAGCNPTKSIDNGGL